MGKAGKAEPKKEAAGDKGKAAAASEKSKDAAKAPPKEPEKAEDPQAKLLEEAQQAYAADERDEQARCELRKINRERKASGAQLKGNRDKSIARVTRFQNRLKLFKGDSELDVVMKDIDGVDASKYVSELAENLLEAAGNTLKLKELNAVSKVCSKLNATYEEFSSLLAKGILKAFQSTAASELNRRRFLFRMCAELCLIECVDTAKPPILDMLKELCDISVNEDQVVINFTIISSLAQKHAVSCFNVVPAKQKSYAEALGKEWPARQCVLEEAHRNQMLQLAVNAFQSAGGGLLQGAHAKLLEQEKVNSQLRVDKGQVDAENEQKHAELKEKLQKTQTTLTTLSECFNQPMPTTQEEEDPNVSRVGQAQAKEEIPEEEEILIFEDSEQKKFYEDLIDLKDVIPAVLLGSKGAAAAEAGAGEEKPEKPPETEKPKDVGTATDFDLWLMRVPKAESAKQVDDIVIEFFHDYNTKANRRSLAGQLYGVHKTKQLHLLAPHARLAALVGPYIKDVPNYLMSWLQQDLEQVINDANQNLLEQKVKIVKYLCELCKFKVCPPGIILDTFKTLCDDFSQQNAELCAHILQTCGRFLLYKPETATRTENLLERMLRLTKAKSLPLRLEIMLEDAYYQVKPPEGKRQKKKEKDPLEQFVEYLIFDRLYKEEDEDKILKLCRKLPWDGPAVGWLKKCILDLNHHANYENLASVASLLSGLARYRDAFVIDTIDSLFENIQVTLERNDFREMPLRVRQVKLLGELYNYRLIDSLLVFDSLYQFIGFGGASAFKAGHVSTVHKIVERALALRKGGLGSISEEAGAEEGDEGAQQLPQVLADPQHPVEAPWDFFRIKLVCVLLETCGHYFDRGAAKQKLDRFLQFFIRYVHSKGELPQRFMNMVYDTLEKLRPKLVYPEAKTDAEQAVVKILDTERKNLDFGDAEKPDGKDEEDEDEDDESSEEDSGSEEEDESSEEDSDEEGEESESEDEDDDAYDRGDDEQKHAAEDDFDKEVQQMLIESLEKEKNAPRVLTELPAPTLIAKKSENMGDQPFGSFGLLQKKAGGKMIMKAIDIPDDSKLVQARLEERHENDKEKEDLKRFVMQYDEVGSGDMSGSVIPVTVRTRAGKGGKKGYPTSRRDEGYLKAELMPEESKPEAAMTGMAGGIVIRYKGKGGKVAKGGGGKGGAIGAGSSGSRSGPARGKGTPSEASREAL
eukprot:TRINITY_DN35795_c0_g1_i1.p1 TRINITY_DN35795_c0_g1~~TRINITY_DN35795_c0_g1_i1.p1  ORF type:complete len:1224 (-),score=400.36 TRINITY_DN35795_c0_g1_i1:222-3830(-)